MIFNDSFCAHCIFVGAANVGAPDRFKCSLPSIFIMFYMVISRVPFCCLQLSPRGFMRSKCLIFICLLDSSCCKC